MQKQTFCSDQSHLGLQPWALGCLDSILWTPVFAWTVLRWIQPCHILVLTFKLVCSFGLNSKLTLYLTLLCLMIIRLSPKLVSYQSSPAWLCWTAPHQWRRCLVYILGKQLIFPHEAALGSAWQPEQTLKIVVKRARNISAFSIIFAINSPPLGSRTR